MNTHTMVARVLFSSVFLLCLSTTLILHVTMPTEPTSSPPRITRFQMITEKRLEYKLLSSIPFNPLLYRLQLETPWTRYRGASKPEGKHWISDSVYWTNCWNPSLTERLGAAFSPFSKQGQGDPTYGLQFLYRNYSSKPYGLFTTKLQSQSQSLKFRLR
jgi:hypothetical protein